MLYSPFTYCLRYVFFYVFYLIMVCIHRDSNLCVRMPTDWDVCCFALRFVEVSVGFSEIVYLFWDVFVTFALSLYVAEMVAMYIGSWHNLSILGAVSVWRNEWLSEPLSRFKAPLSMLYGYNWEV